MAEKRKQDQPSDKSKKNFKRAKSGGGAKLEAGMKGVLISHDRYREKSCRIDSFKLLNHFADEMYGPEKEEKVQAISDDEDDIESALSNEVSEIKDFTKSHDQRRFSAVRSGCNNLIFIRFKGIVPGAFMSGVVQKICDTANFEEAKIPHVKHMLRVHPVDFSCSAYLDNMCKNIPIFLEKRFKELETDNTGTDVLKQFNIEYKGRNNSHLSRQTVLDGLYEAMKDSSSGWKYNCRSQSLSVIIDVLKTVCLVSVVQNYYNFRKYNIRELFLRKCAKKDDKEEVVIKQQMSPKLCDENSNNPDESIKITEIKYSENIYEQALLGSESSELSQNTATAKIENLDETAPKPTNTPEDNIEAATKCIQPESVTNSA